MKRGWQAAAFLATVALAGCATSPTPQTLAYYNAPSNAYTINLGSQVFQGAVDLSEQCEPYGGSLNVWDGKKRFFRIDYLNFLEHPVVHPPSFASDRTLNDMVLGYYMSDVLDQSKDIVSRKVLFKDTVNSRVGEGLLTIVSLQMQPGAVPASALDNTVYYGFFIFRRGDFAYVIQHRQEIYQPERMKTMLVSLALDMTIPGKHQTYDKVSDMGVVDKVFASQAEIDAWKTAMKCM